MSLWYQSVVVLLLVMQPSRQLLASLFRLLGSKRTENFTKWPRQSLLGSVNGMYEKLPRKWLFQGLSPTWTVQETGRRLPVSSLFAWEHLVASERWQSSSEKTAGLPCSRSIFVNNAWVVVTACHRPVNKIKYGYHISFYSHSIFTRFWL